MSIEANGRERPGLLLAAGALLSCLGVVMVALVCCGIPVLTGAAGVFAAAGAMAGNLWFVAAAALAAGLLLLQAQRRSSPGMDCCDGSRPEDSLSAAVLTPTSHLSPEQERSGLSRSGASAAKDAGSRA
ncbi:hypothetical protein D7Z96_15045 [Pseudarthrobacter phenanthrenivorans]|uniref:Uncharacterized protein n=1 Tax=Pseudarthrobacter phenanthrenivorans TaxID=361575 RepID=A0A3B0FG60_PSEPS|nr:hypothetical protein [Pseudarthrobacter phenanthrenivorans]RKO21873.1 hypothetical protein D7Z96_15045 [Pseudarthrobacter phenanthrenivorans]